MEWGDPDCETIQEETKMFLTGKDYLKFFFQMLAIAGIVLSLAGLFVTTTLSFENGILMILLGVIGIVVGIFGLKKFAY